MTTSINMSDYPSINVPADRSELETAIVKLRYEFDTRLTKDLQTYDALINERLDERDRRLSDELKQFTYEQIMKALYQSKQPQASTGADALFWKEIKNIFSEEMSDSPMRLWNFVADWAQKQGVPGGNEIYQHGGNLIKKQGY